MAPGALANSATRRATDIAGVVLFVLVLAIISWRVAGRINHDAAKSDADLSAMCDFREVVYYPTRAVFEGVNPYDNRVDDVATRYRQRYPVGNVFPLYSPVLFLVCAPLAILPLPIAEASFWLINVGLLLTLAVVAWRLAGVRPSVGQVTLLAALLLLSRPGHANLYFGQVTLIVTLACVAALYFARSRPNLAAIALTIATLKPTFGAPLALLMLARGEWRAALRGLALAGAIALVGGAIIVVRDPHFIDLPTLLATNQQGTNNDPAVNPLVSGSRIDLVFVVERLFGGWLPSVARIGLTLLILASSMLALRRSSSGATQLRDGLVLVTIAICIYHNIYDALLLVVPAVWLFVILRQRQTSSRLPGASIALIGLLVPAVNYLSSAQFHRLLVASLPLDQLPAVVAQTSWTMASLLSGICVSVAWLILLIASFRFQTKSVALTPPLPA